MNTTGKISQLTGLPDCKSSPNDGVNSKISFIFGNMLGNNDTNE